MHGLHLSVRLNGGVLTYMPSSGRCGTPHSMFIPCYRPADDVRHCRWCIPVSNRPYAVSLISCSQHISRVMPMTDPSPAPDAASTPTPTTPLSHDPTQDPVPAQGLEHQIGEVRTVENLKNSNKPEQMIVREQVTETRRVEKPRLWQVIAMAVLLASATILTLGLCLWGLARVESVSVPEVTVEWKNE